MEQEERVHEMKSLRGEQSTSCCLGRWTRRARLGGDTGPWVLRRRTPFCVRFLFQEMCCQEKGQREDATLRSEPLRREQRRREGALQKALSAGTASTGGGQGKVRSTGGRTLTRRRSLLERQDDASTRYQVPTLGRPSTSVTLFISPQISVRWAS